MVPDLALSAKVGLKQGATGNLGRSLRKARPMTQLSSADLDTLKPGRHSDGKGLSLNVRPSGARSWSYQYRVGDRVKEMGLGAAAGAGREGLTLEQARAAAQGHRDARKVGADPLNAKRKADEAAAALDGRTTFGEFARGHIEKAIAPEFRGTKTAKDWQRCLTCTASRCCRSARPISPWRTWSPACAPIWQTKTKTATELRGRIERLLDAAKVKGLRTGDNPARWAGGLREICRSRSARKITTPRRITGTCQPLSPNFRRIYPCLTCRKSRSFLRP